MGEEYPHAAGCAGVRDLSAPVGGELHSKWRRSAEEWQILWHGRLAVNRTKRFLRLAEIVPFAQIADTGLAGADFERHPKLWHAWQPRKQASEPGTLGAFSSTGGGGPTRRRWAYCAAKGHRTSKGSQNRKGLLNRKGSQKMSMPAASCLVASGRRATMDGSLRWTGATKPTQFLQ